MMKSLQKNFWNKEVEGSKSEDRALETFRDKRNKKSLDFCCYVTGAWKKGAPRRRVWSVDRKLHSLIREPKC